jgi:hypothetical protein
MSCRSLCRDFTSPQAWLAARRFVLHIPVTTFRGMNTSRCQNMNLKDLMLSVWHFLAEYYQITIFILNPN